MNIEDIEKRIGDTPLLDLTPPGCRSKLFAKAEYHNLSGSIKDRAAFNMLKTAQENGSLKPGRMILDATSGNTGISLAVIGRLMGHPATLVIPPQVSVERLNILKSAGAELVFSDPTTGSK